MIRPDNSPAWDRVKYWFNEVLEQTPETRDAFLNEHLRDVPLIAAEVRSLLNALQHGDERFEPSRARVGATTPPDGAVAIGADIGVWHVLKRIGEGGMATVYEAVRRDLDMPKRAALKTVRGRSSDALRHRFARERRILATLEHPNIATLLDGGTLADGAPWFAMEFVEGVRIDDWCAQRRLDLKARIRLILQVCRAVQYAHNRLVVHRDLKPSNILVTADGTVKLLDFGIAKLITTVDLGDETATGALMLTTDYASPEQLRGDPVTTASDVYSLGVVLFELLSGVRPFAMRGHGLRELRRLADTEAPMLTAVVSELSAREAGFADAQRLRAEVHGDLEAITAKALRKDPGERYSSAERLADDLVAWLESRPVSAQPDSLPYRVRRLSRRYRRTLLLSGGLAFAATAFAGALTWQARRTDQQQKLAVQRLTEVRTLAQTLVYDVNDQLAEVPGAIALRASVVRTALRSLDNASTDGPNDPALMRELAFAYQRAGDVLGNPTAANLGDLPGAVAAYGRAVSIARALVATTPDDVSAMWTLALCTEKAADAEAPSGQVQLALEHQRESLGLFREIARTDSTRTNYLRAVGVSALKLGDLLGHPAFTNTGDTGASLRAYREAMEQLDRAAQRGDTTYFVRRHRAVAGERLGRLLQEREAFPEARQWLDASLALRRELSKENPKSVQSRRDLAIALYVSCGLSLAEQLPRVAVTTCIESLAIRQALLADDGQNGALLRGMGIMHRRMGEVRAALADTTAALAEYADAVSYYERFFGNRAGAINDRRDLAYTLLERADLASGKGARSSAPLAERSFHSALASFDSISTKMALTGADSTRIEQTRERLASAGRPE